MNGFTLVSTEALSGNLGRWRVFDCRHDLAQPALGEAQSEYLQARSQADVARAGYEVASSAGHDQQPGE